MHPFYFGTSSRPLFGVYQPPQRVTSPGRAAVVCYPFGQEYMRGHRAFRQLSVLLARAGYHVLRFDYFGTGDSSGRGDEARMAQWITDIGTAIDELSDMSDIDRIALIGTRIGCPLAVEAAAERGDVAAIALWDPVVSGSRYVEEITRDMPIERDTWANQDQIVASVNGFPLTAGLLTDFLSLDLTRRRPSVPTRIIVSSADESYDALTRAWPGVAYAHVPSKGNWNEVDNFGSALVPQEIIRNIVDWFDEGYRN